MARPAAKGDQDPDPKWRGSVRSSHLRAISLGDLDKWSILRLDIESFLRRADGCGREAFLRALAERDPRGPHLIREMFAPAYGLSVALAGFRKTLRLYLL